jgi:hypothetical protein
MDEEEVKAELLIQHYDMKTWGSGGTTPPFLTSALDGVVRFTPLPLYP